MSAGYDAETLALLSPEERAAMEDTPSDAELAALKAVAGDDDEGDEDTDGDDAEGDDDKDDDEGESDDGAPAPSPSPAPAPAEPSPAPQPAPAPQPQYQAKLPDDFDAQVNAVKTREDQAWEKFEAGELDRAQLQAELNEVAGERAKLDRLATKAEIAQEMTAQSAEAQWLGEIASLKTRALNSHGVDYNTDEARAADLDTFVKALASDPKNGDKSMQWFLDEAHKRVVALHAIPARASTPTAPATPADAKAAAKAARKANAAALPTTLAQVPGGDGPGDVGGEFAELDRLNGDELEDAIKRLTPAQRERYAKGL